MAFPGLIAMFSALTVVGLEMYLTSRGAGHSHSHDWTQMSTEEHSSHDDEFRDAALPVPMSDHLNGTPKNGQRPGPRHITTNGLASSEGLLVGSLLSPRSPADASRDDAAADDDADDSDLDSDHPGSQTPQPLFSREEEQKRQVMQCLLLEAGILFHSVFIGMAVSVATGPPFVVFLIAIAFHQTFEGLALGSRIAVIDFPAHSMRPWIMVLAYGTTTPLGQAIGLLVHNMYDPRSAVGLLMVGVMNAISSGLLLFAGLVQLLAADFLSDKSYVTLKGSRRQEAFCAVLAGASLMALVGAWA